MKWFRLRLRHYGFTLVELIVVMTILAIVAFVAVPQYRYQLEAMRSRRAVEMIVSALRYARVKALTIGRPVMVQLDRQQGTITVLLPGEIVARRPLGYLGSQVAGDLSDEEWQALFGERLETLDPNELVEDPSRAGRQRTLPQEVKLESVQDTISGEELNLVAFYPDGTASGVQIVLSSPARSVMITIDPLTGRVRTTDAAQRGWRRQR